MFVLPQAQAQAQAHLCLKLRQLSPGPVQLGLQPGHLGLKLGAAAAMAMT